MGLLQEQHAKDDSVKAVALEQLGKEDARKEDEAVFKLKLADSLKQYTEFLTRERGFLIQLNASLYTANDEMNNIKQFHFGRLNQVREAQIRSQVIVIQNLQQQQLNLQSNITMAQDGINRVNAELQKGDFIQN